MPNGSLLGLGRIGVVEEERCWDGGRMVPALTLNMVTGAECFTVCQGTAPPSPPKETITSPSLFFMGAFITQVPPPRGQRVRAAATMAEVPHLVGQSQSPTLCAPLKPKFLSLVRLPLVIQVCDL